MSKRNLPAPLDQSTAWAAAAIAFRANGDQYVKVIDATDDRRTNIDLVYEIINSPNLDATILKHDHELGQQIRKYIGLTATAAALRGTLDSWGQEMARVSQLDEIAATYDLHIIASLPATYHRYLQREKVHQRLNECVVFAPRIGDKVEIDCEVLESKWSQKWSTYYITVVDSHNHAFFFAYRNQIKPGTRFTARGTVKRISGNQIQLNRVKTDLNQEE